MELDEKDRAIIEELNTDARRSFVDIAEDLEMNETTVRRRVNRMEEEDVIQGYDVILNPSEVGYDVTAVVGFDAEPEHFLEVVNAVAERDEVRELVTASGDHMVLAEVWAEDSEAMGEFVEELAGMEGVEEIKPAVILQRVVEGGKEL